MPRYQLCVFPLLAIFIGMPRVALRAEVVISEIMYDPSGTDNDVTVTPQVHREWVELYNTGTTYVDLTGWQLADSADGQFASPFPAGTTIGPSQALVVTGDTIRFDLEWGTGINRILVNNWPTLANDTSSNVERVAIRDNLGFYRDQVQYQTDNGWPRLDGSDGQSIFLVPQALSSTANDNGANWKPAMQGVYGAVFKDADGENHGSPGVVATVPQSPFVPMSDVAWSMAVIPDTQCYVKSSLDKGILTQMTQWIRDNRDAYKIKAVLQEGDIVNNNDTNNPTSGDQVSSQQWQSAQTSFFVLNGYVPYILAAGNHDYGFTDADNRDTMINTYFKTTDNPLNDPAQGGILKGTKDANDISNAYYALTGLDGRKMLIFSLEWQPRPATVAWANSIAALPQYADYTAVLLTHDYLEPDNTRSAAPRVAGDAAGEQLWQSLVKTHSNFEMVLNGHFHGDGVGRLDSIDNAGKIVHQMFLDTQWEGFGGDGWIRLIEFLQDGKTVRVRTYSPFHDLERTSSDYSFAFQLTPLDGDYNGDRIVNAADYVWWRQNSGLAASYTAWRSHYGMAAGSGSGMVGAGVPEPGMFTLAILAATIIGNHRAAGRTSKRRLLY